MIVNLQSLFDGGFQINEELQGIENNKGPLKTLEGKPIKQELYGEFKRKKETFPILSKENKKYESILTNLQAQGLVTNKTIEELSNQNLNDININDLDIIPSEEKKILEQVFSNIKHPEKNKKDNKKKLAQDINQIQSIVGKENFDFSLEKNNTNFSEEVLNVIGGNYLSFPNKKGEGEINYKESFSMAIDTTKIQIENEIQNINKDSETYIKAIKNIDSDNIATKLEGIQSLYVLAYSGEGKFGKKKLEKYKAHRLEKLEIEKQKIKLEIQELEKNSKENNEQKIQKLQEQLESIKKEKDEITSGEIFESGELDLSSDKKETPKKSSN